MIEHYLHIMIKFKKWNSSSWLQSIIVKYMWIQLLCWFEVLWNTTHKTQFEVNIMFLLLLILTTEKQTPTTLTPNNILKFKVNVQDFKRQQLRHFVWDEISQIRGKWYLERKTDIPHNTYFYWLIYIYIRLE